LLLSLISVFREKTGLVRNDILDWMIELRKRGKINDEDNKLSANNLKNGPKFGKFSITVIERER
jgi:hypothetical protein